MRCLCLSYGPSRISVICSNCVLSPSHLEEHESWTLSFQCGATVDISTQHSQASSCCFLLGYLDFPPSTYVVQESARFESLCANIRALPLWLPSLWNFPAQCSVLLRAPNSDSDSQANKTAPLLECGLLLSRYECCLVPACFRSLSIAFKRLVLYFV